MMYKPTKQTHTGTCSLCMCAVYSAGDKFTVASLSDAAERSNSSKRAFVLSRATLLVVASAGAPHNQPLP